MKINKKIIATLLLLGIGITSYGVYSVYNASGTFTTKQEKGSNTVYFNDEKFNPRVTNNLESSSVFFSEGQTFDLSCSTSSPVCTGDLYIINKGTSAIEVEIINPSIELDNDSLDSELVFNWNNATVDSVTKKATIGVGETAILNATVNIITDVVVDTGSEPVKASAPIGGEGSNIILNFNMKAVQVH